MYVCRKSYYLELIFCCAKCGNELSILVLSLIMSAVSASKSASFECTLFVIVFLFD